MSRTAAGALLVGVLAAGGLAAAPPGNASCLSVFGRNNSDLCFSSATGIAIALGDSAVAFANGRFVVAFADSRGVADPPTGCNTAGGGGDRCTKALVGSDPGTPEPTRQSVAVALGEGATAAVAIALNPCLGCIAVSADPWDATSILGGSLNAAIAVGNRNRLGANPIADIAGGSGNLAAVIGTRNVAAGTYAAISGKGNRNLAVNIGTTNTNGSGVQVGAPGKPATSSVAFDLAGGRRVAGNNLVNAKGDRAVAGAIGQTGASVSQSGPGRTIRRGAPTAAAGSRQPGRLGPGVSGS
jgi:hypothetical protein